MRPPDPTKPPIRASELEREAADEDRTELRPSDAPGHTLPASESSEKGEGQFSEPAAPTTILPPD
jgi:hypothetical protein